MSNDNLKEMTAVDVDYSIVGPSDGDYKDELNLRIDNGLLTNYVFGINHITIDEGVLKFEQDLRFPSDPDNTIEQDYITNTLANCIIEIIKKGIEEKEKLKNEKNS